MRTIAHLSHLKIGRCPQERLLKLQAWMERLHPSLTTISGGLTASGSQRQLEDAHRFLSQLPQPQILVPGDSDAPIWDPVLRLISPWENFDNVFGKNRTPYFADNEIVVAGMRTAASLPFVKPRLSDSEKMFLQELMATAESGLVKVVVSHRPIFLPDKFEPSEEDGRVFRSQVDLFITSQMWSHRDEGMRESDTTVFVGTRPADAPGFQILRVQSHEVMVENYLWDAQQRDFRLQASNQKVLTVLNRKTA